MNHDPEMFDTSAIVRIESQRVLSSDYLPGWGYNTTWEKTGFDKEGRRWRWHQVHYTRVNGMTLMGSPFGVEQIG